ncbi:MAG: cell division protein ZapA [Muribaculaceae bacterium]|nr:cell division protein ZapA [Muribaculaceae bacterium]
MEQKQNISIRIAGTPPIPMRINRDDEEVIRIAERNVNDLFKAWSLKFRDKGSEEILAMVAFRFAELYFNQQTAVSGIDNILTQIENELDNQLQKLDDTTTP